MNKRNKKKGKLGIDLTGKTLVANVEIVKLIYTEPYNQFHVRLINVEHRDYYIDTIDVNLIVPSEVLLPDPLTTRGFVLAEPYAVYDLDYEDYVLLSGTHQKLVLSDDFSSTGNYTVYDENMTNGLQKVAKHKEQIVRPNDYEGTTESIMLSVIRSEKVTTEASIPVYGLTCTTETGLELYINCHLTIKQDSL